MKTNTKIGRIGLGLLALCFSASVAQAWHVSGRVLCDEDYNHQIDAGDSPVIGVMVAVENAAGTFFAVGQTDANGAFSIVLPDVPDSYLTYLHPPTVPPGANILLPVGGVHAFSLVHGRDSFNQANFLLDCSPTTSPPGDDDEDCGKVTGGGWIVGTPSGSKGTFGVSGGIKHDEFWGNLNYVDHGTGLHIRSTAVTGFELDPAHEDGRYIHYNVLIGTTPGTAVVRVVDNGEPGHRDIFEITLSNGYTAQGQIGGARPGGGNIQLHKCPPGWAKKGRH